MAEGKLITSSNRYVGDTADDKPTGVPVGSTYLDRQTGALYVTYDGTLWVEWDRLVKLVAGTAAVGKLAANDGVDVGDVTVNNAVGAGVYVRPGTGYNLDTAAVKSKAYATWATGEIQGNAAATVMPTLTCEAVKFKAQWGNAGNVYIGIAGVTIPDGTSDTTSGWELAPGEETPWLDAANLNVFYRICNNAGDDLTYIARVS